MILELGGRHGAVLRFLPPLIFSAAEIDEISARFRTALRAALADRAAGAASTSLAAE